MSARSCSSLVGRSSSPIRLPGCCQVVSRYSGNEFSHVSTQGLHLEAGIFQSKSQLNPQSPSANPHTPPPIITHPKNSKAMLRGASAQSQLSTSSESLELPPVLPNPEYEPASKHTTMAVVVRSAQIRLGRFARDCAAARIQANWRAWRRRRLEACGGAGQHQTSESGLSSFVVVEQSEVLSSEETRLTQESDKPTSPRTNMAAVVRAAQIRFGMLSLRAKSSAAVKIQEKWRFWRRQPQQDAGQSKPSVVSISVMEPCTSVNLQESAPQTVGTQSNRRVDPPIGPSTDMASVVRAAQVRFGILPQREKDRAATKIQERWKALRQQRQERANYDTRSNGIKTSVIRPCASINLQEHATHIAGTQSDERNETPVPRSTDMASVVKAAQVRFGILPQREKDRAAIKIQERWRALWQKKRQTADYGLQSHEASTLSRSDVSAVEIHISQEDVRLQRVELLKPSPVNTSGGSCDLFVGTHHPSGIKLAMKRLRGIEGRDEFLKRLLKEAKLWSLLKHSNILPFLGALNIGGQLHLISPWIEFGDLSGFVKRRSRYLKDSISTISIPNEDLERIYALYHRFNEIQVAHEIAAGIAYLHSHSMVHGDLKGPNVLISNSGSALICDFGLTKISGTATSLDIKGYGSLRWQSPELFDDHPKTFKSDVYAFAMIIVEIITGDYPYPDVSGMSALLVKVLCGDRPPFEPLERSGVRFEGLWDLAARCWETEPDNRPSIDEVITFLDSQPTVLPEA